ncbi:MAG: hypothetical protein IKV92_04980 [Akkermansia sp.]|nr:hypothetical protein [Akkermansia sp.]
MEHIFFKTTAVAVMTAAAVFGNTESTTPLPCPTLNLPLVIENADVKERIERGMIDLLLGWEESAAVHFAHAIDLGAATENTSLMAYCGMMMASTTSGARDANRMLLEEKIEKVPSTPVELFYLNSFLKLMGNDMVGAANDFAERAEKYKRDQFSALWAIMLYHCASEGYDMLGRANEHQQKALDLAEKLYTQYPENSLVCYVRAYIEEAAPQVSERAMEAAFKAANGMPEHPMPQLLYGHLLYRAEHAEEALKYIKKAVELSDSQEIKPHEARLNMTAKLYESTALWSARKTAEALASRRALNAVPLDRENLDSPAVILQRWEAATLPLRVLVLRATPPDLADIRAAANAATPQPALPGDDAVLHVRDCLRASLYVRARMAKNDTVSARKSLQLAKESFEKFKLTRDEVFNRSNAYITPWYRAHEACSIAILAAGNAIAPDSDDFWKKIADSVRLPVHMLLPPPLPQQFGPEPPPQQTTKATSKSKKKPNKRL